MISSQETDIEYLPEDYSQHDLAFKIIVVGDSFVGKSSLTIRAVRESFDTSYNTTIGFEFCSFNVKIKEKVVKLQIWDTAGQEKYKSMIPTYLRNAEIVVLVFDLTSKPYKIYFR